MRSLDQRDSLAPVGRPALGIGPVTKLRSQFRGDCVIMLWGRIGLRQVCRPKTRGCLPYPYLSTVISPMKKRPTTVLATVWLLLACAGDTTPPKVVSTVPANGDQSVDPSLSTLSVTFDEAMTDGNWSWAYTTKETFPEMTGPPRYEDGYTKNVLPVRLEPNKEYEVWLNSSKFKNFKDKAGNPLAPYKLVFKTR